MKYLINGIEARDPMYILSYGGMVLLPFAGNNLCVDNCFVVYQMVSNTGPVDDYIDLNIGKVGSNKMD